MICIIVNVTINITVIVRSVIARCTGLSPVVHEVESSPLAAQILVMSTHTLVFHMKKCSGERTFMWATSFFLEYSLLGKKTSLCTLP